MSTEVLYLLLPELVVVLAATAIFVGGAFFPRLAMTWGWLAAAALALAGALVCSQQQGLSVPAALEVPSGPLHGPLVIDLLGQTARGVILVTGLLLVLMTARSTPHHLTAEYVGSLLLVTSGLMIVAMAGDLVLMFVGLELVSIPTYVVLALGRKDAASQESAMKYFFLSILSSAVLLYGFSFVYGACGTTSLAGIHHALAGMSESSSMGAFAQLALVFIAAGLGFRFTAVPFHFYAPDVYQGTSHANAGLLSVVPKIAGLLALVRVAMAAMPGLEQIGWQLSLGLAVVTMTLGNVVALWQNNVRRMMAYSSIAHAGYMLIGVAVGFAANRGAPGIAGFNGIGATLFYLLVYAVATLGTFAALAALSSASRQIDSVDDLAGLADTHKVLAATIAVFMFSLTGLPTFAGFWGKFELLGGAMGIDPQGLVLGEQFAGWFVALAVIGVLNAAISAAYYLRIVAAMYFRPSLGTPDAQGGAGPALVAIAAAIVTIAIGLYPAPLVRHANRAGADVMTTFRRAAEVRAVAAPAESVRTAAAPAQSLRRVAAPAESLRTAAR